MESFLGTWTANLSKSRRHANHQFESATLGFEMSGDAVQVTHSGVNAKGEQESGTTTFHPDGKEYPVVGAPGVVAVAEWVGTRILETTAKKDGKVVGHGTYEISDDGQTLTATVAGIDASGKDFEQIIVWARETS